MLGKNNVSVGSNNTPKKFYYIKEGVIQDDFPYPVNTYNTPIQQDGYIELKGKCGYKIPEGTTDLYNIRVCTEFSMDYVPTNWVNNFLISYWDVANSSKDYTNCFYYAPTVNTDRHILCVNNPKISGVSIYNNLDNNITKLYNLWIEPFVPLFKLDFYFNKRLYNKRFYFIKEGVIQEDIKGFTLEKYNTPTENSGYITLKKSGYYIKGNNLPKYRICVQVENDTNGGNAFNDCFTISYGDETTPYGLSNFNFFNGVDYSGSKVRTVLTAHSPTYTQALVAKQSSNEASRIYYLWLEPLK